MKKQSVKPATGQSGQAARRMISSGGRRVSPPPTTRIEMRITPVRPKKQRMVIQKINVAYPEQSRRRREVIYNAESAPQHERLYAEIMSAVNEVEALGLADEVPAWRKIADAIRTHTPNAVRL